MEIELYREKIKRLAEEKSGEPVYNGSPDHAAVIVENLFLTAQEEVRLLSGDLNSRVYGGSHVVQRAREFLGHSNRKLKVLVERETYSPSHPLIDEMRGHENVELAVIPEDVAHALKYHMMVADRCSYRFEPEKDKHVAVASFGDTEAAAHLAEIFDDIWAMSEKRTIAAPVSS